jgi:hypothetical protein
MYIKLLSPCRERQGLLLYNPATAASLPSSTSQPSAPPHPYRLASPGGSVAMSKIGSGEPQQQTELGLTKIGGLSCGTGDRLL